MFLMIIWVDRSTKDGTGMTPSSQSLARDCWCQMTGYTTTQATGEATNRWKKGPTMKSRRGLARLKAGSFDCAGQENLAAKDEVEVGRPTCETKPTQRKMS
jgi:hypothetical protein